MTLFSRRSLGALLLLLTLAACAHREGPVHGNWFPEQTGWSLAGQTRENVGERIFFGNLWFADLPRGTATVRLVGARILGIPKGLVVSRIAAVRASQVGYVWIEGSGDDAAGFIVPRMHPLTDVVLRRCPPTELCSPFEEGVDWYLVAEAHVTAPGKYATKGVRLFYRVGQDETVYYQDFPDRNEADTWPAVN